MATYIDADLLKKQIEHGAQMTEKRIRLLDLSEQPEADVEPVVRCKYCKYWQDNNGGYPNPECRWGHGETPDENDFCSYGERREYDAKIY